MTPTADLMRLVEKWLEPTPQDECTLYTMGQRTARHVCATQLRAALSALGEARVGGEWVPASVTPDVAKGSGQYFWVTVRRQNGKLYSFPASYANALPLLSEDARDNSGPGWSQRALSEDENDEGDIEITGWYDHKCDPSGEYDTVYQPVCSRGDELVAWMRGPAPCDVALATPAQPKASEGKAGGEDAARIDWLEATARDKYAVTIGEVLQKGCRCLSCWEYGVMDEDEKLGRGETVRAAIDAAMTATLTAPGADDGQ